MAWWIRLVGGPHLSSAVLAAAFVVLAPLVSAKAAERFITVASTTSTENSGLFGHILPLFTGKTGIEVRVIAVGTGQAIRLAERGDADVLFVHHQPSEEKFVREGYGIERLAVMYNDYVVVGPKADPAKIGGLKDASAAFKKIAAAKAPFASRGDNSGTHKAELAVWIQAGIGPKGAAWYRSTGSGMGATLNTAAGMGAYALADRGTWISFKNKRDMTIIVEGDPSLFNPYGVIAVNPAKHPHIRVKGGQTFVSWIISPEGQAAIASFKREGEQLFFPNAKKAGL
jgi:tungstate transport system substrate-binding protein